MIFLSRRLLARMPLAAATAAATVLVAAAAATTAAAAPAQSAAETTTPATRTTSTPPQETTGTSTAAPDLPGGTVVRSWGFESGDTEGWAGAGGATVAVSAQAARSGTAGLLVSGAGSYGSGAQVTLDLTGLQDNVWYDIGVPMKLPDGAPAARYRATVLRAASGLRTPVTATTWGGVSVHLRKPPGLASTTLTVASEQVCAGDPATPSSSFLLDDATMRVSNTQAEITYTQVPCPPVTTTTTTTTGGAPVPGTVVRTWDFENGDLAGVAAAGGTHLDVTPGAARTGTKGLAVSGVAGFGPVLSLGFDVSQLVSGGSYQLTVPIMIPPGGRATTFRVSVPGFNSAPTLIYPGQWVGVPVHFVWSGAATLTATVATTTDCWAELPQAASSFAVDDIVLTVSFIPGGGNPTEPACPPQTTTTTTSTTTSSSPRCTVSYSVVSEWPGGFQGAARLTNTSAGTIPSWVLGMTFPDGQKITQSWGTGGFSQTGATVTFTAPGWAPNLAPNAGVDVGFIGSWSGQNRAPSAITVNGLPCDGPQPTTTTTPTTTTPTTTTPTTTTPTTTTRTIARDGCSWVMAVPGAPATTSGTTTTNYDSFGAQITIVGYGVVGSYLDGSFTWPADYNRLSRLTGADSWSQTGRVVSLTGLHWSTGRDPRAVTLSLYGTSVANLPSSLTVHGLPCSYGYTS